MPVLSFSTRGIPRKIHWYYLFMSFNYLSVHEESLGRISSRFSRITAYVMKGRHNSVLSRIRNVQPELLDIGCICRAANHYGLCNCFILCSCVTALVAHCITRFACLYFGEYPQAVTCSAQPLLWSSHSSCSRPHGLKVFAEPANRKILNCVGVAYNVSWYKYSENNWQWSSAEQIGNQTP